MYMLKPPVAGFYTPPPSFIRPPPLGGFGPPPYLPTNLPSHSFFQGRCVSPLSLRILFSFFALSTPPFPRQFSSPKSPLSGTSDLLFLEKKGNVQGLGFGDGFGGGRPTGKKRKILFLMAHENRWAVKAGKAGKRESFLRVCWANRDPGSPILRPTPRSKKGDAFLLTVGASLLTVGASLLTVP